MPRYSLSDIRTAVMNELSAATPLNAWRKKVYRGEIEKHLEGSGNFVNSRYPNADRLTLFNPPLNRSSESMLGKTIYFRWPLGMLEESSQCSFIHRVNFELICISNKASGQDKRCEELEDLYEDVHDTLVGKRLDMQIKQICCEGWEYLYQDHAITAMTIRFNTLFDYNVTIER
jgi:hypothetical protein